MARRPNGNISSRQRYLVQIPCKLVQSCDTYNRTGEISSDQCVFNLEYSGGFKVNCEPIRVYFDRKGGGIIRVTRGNHRNLKAMLSMGEDAQICGKLIPHEVTSSDEEMLLIEAEDFDEDNQFLGMTKTMKFKGQLFHDYKNPNENPWAKEMYEFLDSCNPSIGIAGTNVEAKIELDAFGAIKTMMAKYEDTSSLDPNSFLRNILETQAKYAITGGGTKTYLSATLTKALASFKKNFHVEITRVKDLNKVDVWSDFMEYIFVNRSKILPMMKNLTQADLIKGNSSVRIPEFHVATLATLFNEYVAMNQLQHDKRKTVAISTTTTSWKKMLENNVKPYFHNIVNQKLSNLLAVQA